MEITKNKTPTADFYNFTIYKIKEFKKLTTEVERSKSIVILLKDAQVEELTLLSKIFQAVGKDLDKDSCILDYSTTSIPYKDIAALFDLNKLLVFGIAPKEVGLHLNVGAYQVVEFQKTAILFSHNLNTIANDLSKKKQLWGQLQLMFK